MQELKMELYKQKMREYDAWRTAGSRGVQVGKSSQLQEFAICYDAGTSFGWVQPLNESEGRAACNKLLLLLEGWFICWCLDRIIA